jgi:hypothetical protein
LQKRGGQRSLRSCEGRQLQVILCLPIFTLC